MSKNYMAELEALKAQLAAKNAELESLKTKSPRTVRNIPEFPKVELKDEAGNVTQREVSFKLISAGGPWYTVAHIAEVVATGERILFLRKYRSVVVKEGKAREGESVGQKVLRQASSFRINASEHWNAIRALGNECFQAPAQPNA